MLNKMDRKLIKIIDELHRGEVAYNHTTTYLCKILGEDCPIYDVPIAKLYHSSEKAINELVKLLSDKKYQILYFVASSGYIDFEEATGIDMLDWVQDNKIKKLSFEKYCMFIDKKCKEVGFDLSDFYISKGEIDRRWIV